MFEANQSRDEDVLSPEDLAKMYEGSQSPPGIDGFGPHALKPYPGFTNRDFTQRPGIDPDPRTMSNAVAWMSESSALHDTRHRVSDHPWCTACLSRWFDASGLPNLPPERLADVVFDRAAGYLALHGRPPRDDWKPDSVGRDFDSLYIGRSELQESVAYSDPLIEGVLNRHSYALLRGRDASFKSFIALDWSLSLATGTSWHGSHTVQTRVLYVAGEGFHGLEDRIAAWESASGVKVSSDWFVVRGGGVNMFRAGDEYQHLLDHVEQGQYGLVVLDTLRRMSGGAGENSSDMGVVVDNIAQVRSRTDDGSVLVIAHTGKSDDDTRGFSGIEDDSDIVWAVKRRTGAMSVELKCTKMKDGRDGHASHLQLTEECKSLVVAQATDASGEIGGGRKHEVDTQVLHSMRTEFGPTGATAKQLMTATSLAQSTVYRSVGRLVDAGLIERVGKGVLSLKDS